MPVAAKYGLVIFSDISPTKVYFRKYLREKYLWVFNLQMSFKCFWNLCIILELFAKVSEKQTTIVMEILKHERVKVDSVCYCLTLWPTAVLYGQDKTQENAHKWP